MQKLLLVVAAIAMLVVGGAIFVWHMNSAPPPEPDDLPPYDYTDAGSWSLVPNPLPPPVWESGWETDVILLAHSPRRNVEDYAAALAEAGPVYAPRLRRSDFARDAADALTYYVTHDNRGRAFVIASDQPMPASLVPVINSDPMLRARFGGILLLDGQEAGFAQDVWPGSVCSDRFGPGELCAEPADIRRESGEWIVAGETPLEGPVLGGFTDWLEQSARRLAPPLGELEDIEIVDIRRPGQTD